LLPFQATSLSETANLHPEQDTLYPETGDFVAVSGNKVTVPSKRKTRKPCYRKGDRAMRRITYRVL